MNTTDRKPFAELYAALADYYRAELKPSVIRLYFEDLADLSLAQIEAAAKAYRMDRKHTRLPLPVELRDLAGGTSHALTPDEAWTIAVRAMDESDTVIWTAQIAQAYSAAQAVYQMGDEVGARMAFRAAYERLERERVLRGEAPHWTVSPGTDPGLRQQRVQEAITQARLGADVAAQYALPAPTTGIAGLLESAKRMAAGGEGDRAAHLADEAIRNLQALRCLLDGKRPESPHQARLRAEQARAAEVKAEQIQQVDEALKRRQADESNGGLHDER